MSKDVGALKNDIKKLDNLSLYEIVTIACVVGIFVNMLFSIEIIPKENIERYFLYTFICGICVSFLFVCILILSMMIFSSSSKNEMNLSSSQKDRYIYYFLLNLLILAYLLTNSLIKSGYFGLDSSGITFVNGIESSVVFLYLCFALAICSPIFVYEFELSKKMKNYDNNNLSNLE